LSTTDTKDQETPETHVHDHDHDHAGHKHSHEPQMNPACKREVSIEIPAAEVKKATDTVAKRFQKLAKIPGFRAGKVPESIVRSRFAEDIRSEVVEQLLPKYYQQAIEKEKLQPVSQPYVTDLKFEEGKPVTFKAQFEVLPEITPKDYKTIPVERQDTGVNDDEVEDALKHLQEQHASFEPVDDRELKDGDFAQVSFVGKALGAKSFLDKKKALAEKKDVGATPASPADDNRSETTDPLTKASAEVGDTISQAVEEEVNKPVEVNDVMVEIGGANTVKDFSENLRGAKPGDEKSFQVTYPDDFADQRLAGQVMNYDVKVQAVKKKVRPELNDDFAKELGEFATVDELRNRIRENMQAEKKHGIEHTAKEKLVDELVKRNDFPVPQTLVDRQIDTRLERGLRALAQQGMREQDMRKLNFARLREGQKEAAIREVKASLLLDKIADLENIQVSDEELDHEIESAARQSQQTLESVRARLEKDGALERIKDRMRNEKALDFLYRQSA
jgi:trigger factor